MSAAARMYRNWLSRTTCACGAPVAHVVGVGDLPIPAGLCQKCHKAGADPVYVALVQLGRYTRLLDQAFAVEPPKEKVSGDAGEGKRKGVPDEVKELGVSWRNTAKYSYDVMAKYSIAKAAYPRGEPYKNMSPEAWAKLCRAVDGLIKEVRRWT